MTIFIDLFYTSSGGAFSAAGLAWILKYNSVPYFKINNL